MFYKYESPCKDRSTNMCVCVLLCKEGEFPRVCEFSMNWWEEAEDISLD